MRYMLKEYLRYKWKAKGRHGTHSPFVYTFIEEVLMKARSQEALINNIAAYYSIKKVINLLDGPLAAPLRNGDEHSGTLSFHRLIITDINAVGNLEEMPETFAHDDIILVQMLNGNENARKYWNELCKNNRISLSIDLYHTGLFFFRKEFKQKQHFILNSKF